MALKLMLFDVCIKYREGVYHGNADTLNRQSWTNEGSDLGAQSSNACRDTNSDKEEEPQIEETSGIVLIEKKGGSRFSNAHHPGVGPNNLGLV